MALTPTDEQRYALEQFQTGDDLVIEAGAGAGKSTTLRLLAEKGETGKGLYIAFNKSVQTAAKKLFAGTDIEPRTAHSLAYPEFGAPRRDRMNMPLVPWRERVASLRVDPYTFAPGAQALLPRVDAVGVARAADATVANFCRSADFELNTTHVKVPTGVWANEHAMDDFRTHVLRVAERIWKDVLSPSGSTRVTHDHYLKMFQLSEPSLGVDTIFLDEAQDADGVMLSIIQSQFGAQQVAVGDRNQAIYAWRGAIDAMDAFPEARTARLSQSFRFGPAIAEEANLWLQLLRSDMRITGSGNPDSEVGDFRRADAVLVRSNGGAVAEMMESQERGQRVGLAGQNRARELQSLAQAAVDLTSKGWTGHPELALFKSWYDVVEFSATDEGASFAPFVKVVESYTAPAVVQAIGRCVEPSRADVVIATAHVAKGLEWGTVRIADDFRGPREDKETGDQILPSDEELRLAYVAITRARDGLDLGSLDWAREALGEVVFSS